VGAGSEGIRGARGVSAVSAGTDCARLTIVQPDDWHLHVRDVPFIASVLPGTLRCYRRAIIMPNLHPPVTTVASAAAYRSRILKAVPDGADFEPLMTLYLSDHFDVSEIRRAKESGFVHAVKLYPKGIAHAGQPGVSAIERCFPAFEAMERHDFPLLVHGESTDTAVDAFDREAVFVENTLTRIVNRFPALRVVLEHISTRQAAEFVLATGASVGATVTPQHMLLNRNVLFEQGIRPHHYCIPLLKREEHRLAIVGAVTSGSRKFFLGTDSAPHARSQKEQACGCPGIYTAHASLELYAMAFEEAGAMHRLEEFASFNGPDFYRLPRNAATITLEKRAWELPKEIPYGDGEVLIPLFAGTSLPWRLVQ
jgi:dihydroorotase